VRGGLPIGRLLLAEDNVVNQKVAVAMLSSAGYQVDTVFDGAAAVTQAAEEHYDAILMDCQMPGLSGYEATAAIRASEAADRHTPIIAMTAGARSEDRERCLAAGMDSYLAKPASKDALLALVAAALGTDPHWPVPAASEDGANPADVLTLDPTIFGELSTLGGHRERLIGGDLLAELVGEFIADTEARLVQLDDFLLANEAVAVARFAYLIKGSAGQLGGRRLAVSCGRLEQHAAAGSLSLCRADLGDVERDYRALRIALTAQLSAGTPRRRFTDSPTGAPNGPPAGPTAPAAGRSGTVLVADNNRVSQQVARAMLESLGFDVDVVRDGVAAVRAAGQKPYRAILIDCSTQALDSDHTTTEIRRQAGTSPRATIIAVSASPTPAERQRCLMSGMDDFLAKPFRTDALVALLGGAPEEPEPAISADWTRRIESAEGPADPDPPVLDPTVLAQLEQLGAGMGQDLLGELAGLFLEDAASHVAALRLARHDGDTDQIARSAHALSGASGNLGATELARLCAAAASPAGAAELLADPSLLEAITSELGRVRSCLDAHGAAADIQTA
jgi:CheY-like chemotaxis protein